MTASAAARATPVVEAVSADPLAGDIAFRRGWIARVPPATPSPSASTGPGVLPVPPDWRRYTIGRATLAVHPARDVSVAVDDAAAVAIIGWAVDTTARSADQVGIVRLLHGLLREGGEAALVRYAAYLAGRFVLLSARGGNLQVMPDAVATVPGYVGEAAGTTWLGSHASLIAEQTGAEIDHELRAFLAAAGRASRYVVFRPGARGDYRGVRHLLPNHVWRMPEGGKVAHERFYPFPDTVLREPLGGRERFAHHFDAHVQAICELERVTVSLTGGTDSGTSFRAVRRHARGDGFTWTMVREGHVEMEQDAAAAAARSRAAGFEHRTIPLPVAAPSSFEAEARRSFGAGLQALGFATTAFAALPADIVNVQSMLAEIGTGFYTRRTRRVPTADGLARTHTSAAHGTSRFTREAFAAFIEYADFRLERFGPWSWYDMLYWESRAGLWTAARVAELELAHRVEMPYNSRHVLEALASGDWRERQGRILQSAFIQEQ